MHHDTTFMYTITTFFVPEEVNMLHTAGEYMVVKPGSVLKYTFHIQLDPWKEEKREQ